MDMLGGDEGDSQATLERDRREVEAQLSKSQSDLDKAKGELKHFLGSLQDEGEGVEESEAMVKLRAKTLEVAELSSKIDELQARNDQLEVLTKKIETYDLAVYEEARKAKTVQQITKEIQEKSANLDAFPRKNRHCVEWYDKYSAKFTELKKKFEEQVETEQGILRLLKDLDD